MYASRFCRSWVAWMSEPERVSAWTSELEAVLHFLKGLIATLSSRCRSAPPLGLSFHFCATRGSKDTLQA